MSGLEKVVFEVCSIQFEVSPRYNLEHLIGTGAYGTIWYAQSLTQPKPRGPETNVSCHFFLERLQSPQPHAPNFLTSLLLLIPLSLPHYLASSISHPPPPPPPPPPLPLSLSPPQVATTSQVFRNERFLFFLSRLRQLTLCVCTT